MSTFVLSVAGDYCPVAKTFKDKWLQHVYEMFKYNYTSTLHKSHTYELKHMLVWC